jgi:hypothetical protein
MSVILVIEAGLFPARANAKEEVEAPNRDKTISSPLPERSLLNTVTIGDTEIFVGPEGYSSFPGYFPTYWRA